VVYHDIREGNVWISEDEGKAWQQVQGVPAGEALMFFAHPFDARMVRIIKCAYWNLVNID
jgi:hypothetical protein